MRRFAHHFTPDYSQLNPKNTLQGSDRNMFSIASFCLFSKFPTMLNIMKQLILILFLGLSFSPVRAQAPRTWNSAEILLNLKKLNVLGSVLYIAAHPDDENTRLLAWLTNEKSYRTAYLSLTRGDGGQNLIGDEQGVELGLIRTQELLSARRIDGAEQFFSTAYDFGYTKSTDEALQLWNRNQVLSDVVWVIRNFRPDVIITRFPEDSRAGHGQHSASAVLAREAFVAAADPTMFPDQFKYGVKPWQAKRILWNTFNFGGANTQSEDQFKVDVGGFNPLLGKSYGELAAESRSQHKSQGFGVSAQRGEGIEYFKTVLGEPPQNDLMDGVETDWSRVIHQQTMPKGSGATAASNTEATDRLKYAVSIPNSIDSLIGNFSFVHPEYSVPALMRLRWALMRIGDSYWEKRKLAEVEKLILACSGIYMEATTNEPYAIQGKTLRVTLNLVNRSGIPMSGSAMAPFDIEFGNKLTKNKPFTTTKTFVIPANLTSQPYWLFHGLDGGHFVVDDQSLIGLPQNPAAISIPLNLEIEKQFLTFRIPVQYRFTDPVMGEIYQPLAIAPPISITAGPPFVFTHLNNKKTREVRLFLNAKTRIDSARVSVFRFDYEQGKLIKDSLFLEKNLNIPENGVQTYTINTDSLIKSRDQKSIRFLVKMPPVFSDTPLSYAVRRIEYSHIPAITYYYLDKISIINEDIKTDGKKIGYIRGAGDKVAESLQQMDYEVSFLEEKDLTAETLRKFDAIVVGVRAYNVHDWLNNYHAVLMDYVKNGGNLLVQYNTSGYSATQKAKFGPYDFVVSRNRTTDEKASVDFLVPSDPVLNWPNKITEKDFEGWIQERGIYFADQLDPAYKAILSMKDPGEENAQNGSLIVANYGKGRFIYTGLVFFRELPAGVPGAYRLFANLVANPNHQKKNGSAK